MTVSPEKIAEMLAAAEKATPGPWERQAKTDAYTHIVRGPNNAYIAAAPQGSKGQQVADVAHIANCDPQTITAILNELVAARSQLDALTAEPRMPHSGMTATEAASFIDQQSAEHWQSRALAAEAQLARQGEALKPFSEFAGVLFMLNWQASDRVMTITLDGKDHWITVDAFFRVRSALGDQNG